mmetsp:Transcript_26862/g.52597  ORF Transcript_26862/g.52597 Transcript_26862/m.52597 type:complete len:240 (+) Transcript_26862:22-741(+)
MTVFSLMRRWPLGFTPTSLRLSPVGWLRVEGQRARGNKANPPFEDARPIYLNGGFGYENGLLTVGSSGHRGKLRGRDGWRIPGKFRTHGGQWQAQTSALPAITAGPELPELMRRGGSLPGLPAPAEPMDNRGLDLVRRLQDLEKRRGIVQRRLDTASKATALASVLAASGESSVQQGREADEEARELSKLEEEMSDLRFSLREIKKQAKERSLPETQAARPNTEHVRQLLEDTSAADKH